VNLENQSTTTNEAQISGLRVLTFRKFSDDRGYFIERFNKKTFTDLGLPVEYYQDNQSVSKPGVLRGMHVQVAPAQGKLVTCLSGRVLDIAVDLRWDSPTFGRSQSVELSEENTQVFWIPPGFAHGFCVLGDQPAHLFYKVTTPWNAATELTLQFNDPALNLPWPKSDFTLSPKDREGISLAEYKRQFASGKPWWL